MASILFFGITLTPAGAGCGPGEGNGESMLLICGGPPVAHTFGTTSFVLKQAE